VEVPGVPQEEARLCLTTQWNLAADRRIAQTDHEVDHPRHLHHMIPWLG
jgi:hypothetical protein